jgi:hypothetical protein
MHIRIDPVAGDAPIRLLRVESIQPQGRDAEQRETPDRRERAATYAPAPEEETGAYAPAADGPRPAEPVALDGGLAARAAEPLLPPAPAAPPVLAAEPPVLAPVPMPTPDEEERSLYPSGTPAWMTALLKAR